MTPTTPQEADRSYAVSRLRAIHDIVKALLREAQGIVDDYIAKYEEENGENF